MSGIRWVGGGVGVGGRQEQHSRVSGRAVGSFVSPCLVQSCAQTWFFYTYHNAITCWLLQAYEGITSMDSVSASMDGTPAPEDSQVGSGRRAHSSWGAGHSTPALEPASPSTDQWQRTTAWPRTPSGRRRRCQRRRRRGHRRRLRRGGCGGGRAGGRVGAAVHATCMRLHLPANLMPARATERAHPALPLPAAGAVLGALGMAWWDSRRKGWRSHEKAAMGGSAAPAEAYKL